MSFRSEFVFAVAGLLACGASLAAAESVEHAAYALGNRYAEARDCPHAIASYNEALKANPSYSLAYAGLGKCYETLGQADKAIASFRMIIRIEDANPNPTVSPMAKYTAYTRLGNVYMHLGRYDDAIASIQSAIRLNVGQDSLALPLAACYSKKGDHAKSIETLEIALKARPNVLIDRFVLAIEYARAGKKEKALEQQRIVQAADAETGSKLKRKIDSGDFDH